MSDVTPLAGHAVRVAVTLDQPTETRDHAAGHRCDHGHVTAWQDVERAEPEFAQRVRALFDAHAHGLRRIERE